MNWLVDRETEKRPEVHRNVVMSTMTHNFDKEHVINQQLVEMKVRLFVVCMMVATSISFFFIFLMIHFQKYTRNCYWNIIYQKKKCAIHIVDT